MALNLFNFDSNLFNQRLGILNDIATQVGRPGTGQFNYNPPVFATPAAAPKASSDKKGGKGGNKKGGNKASRSAVPLASASARRGSGGSNKRSGGGSSGKKERARIMDKARKQGNRSLSASDLAKLTPGQKKKLGIGVTQDDIYSNPNPVTNPPTPTPGKVVETPDGPRLAPADDPRPDISGQPGSSNNNTDPPPPDFNQYAEAYIAKDPFYQQALSTLAQQRTNALTALGKGEQDLASDYGLGITQDDSGAKFTGNWAASDPNRMGMDPSNPFSRASLLNKSYFVAGRVGSGSYANRGLLTSGAYGRNMQRDALRNEINRDQLIKQFGSSLQDYRQRRADAQNTYTTQSLGARENATQRAIEDYNRRFAN